MRRSRTLRFTFWCLWPLAAYAGSVDVPELGIRFAALPAGASEPQVSAAQRGTQLTTALGPAVLRIYRDEQPAPAGSDVASPDYRASLDARFDKSIDSRSEGAPTAVGGYGAWTVVDARPAESAASTAYICVTYVIVDQHLYRLAVSALGTGRPAEFDALVKALSGITFEPVRHT